MAWRKSDVARELIEMTMLGSPYASGEGRKDVPIRGEPPCL